jgi:nucleoid DNA-binding protein
MATSTAKKTTPTKKPAAAKAAAKPKAAPKAAAPAVKAPLAVVAPVAAAEVPKAARTPAVQLRKKELIARVVDVVGGKKKGVKEIVEATLSVLGEALQKGEALNIPPFGRAKVARQKGEGKTSSMTVKLRGAGEKNAPRGPKEALAEVGEDD